MSVSIGKFYSHLLFSHFRQSLGAELISLRYCLYSGQYTLLFALFPHLFPPTFFTAKSLCPQ